MLDHENEKNRKIYDLLYYFEAGQKQITFLPGLKYEFEMWIEV